MRKTFGHTFFRLILSCSVVFTVAASVNADLFSRSDLGRFLEDPPVADIAPAQMPVTQDTREFKSNKTARAFNADSSQTCRIPSFARLMQPNGVLLWLPGMTPSYPVSGIHSPNLHDRPPPQPWDSDPEHHG